MVRFFVCLTGLLIGDHVFRDMRGGLLAGLVVVDLWRFPENMPVEVRAEFERLILTGSRALEFLASQGCTALGNLVLSRRDSLLADVCSTVPAEEIASLRYSPLPEMVSIFPSPLLDSALTTSSPALVGQSASAASLQPLPPRRLRAEPSRVATLKRHFRKSGFSGRSARVLTGCLRSSTSRLYRSRWQIFCGWCRGRGVAPVNATVPVVVDFLIHLRHDKVLSVSAVKGYSSALNSVLALKGRDLASSREIAMLLRSFSRYEDPVELRLPAWDVALVLQSLTGPPYEPLRTCDERFLAQKTLFLLALASAKRIGELHALGDCYVLYGWSGVTLNALIAHRPHCERLFVTAGRSKKEISKTTVSFWLRKTISRAYQLPGTEQPVPAPRARETLGTAPSLLFKKNFAGQRGATTGDHPTDQRKGRECVQVQVIPRMMKRVFEDGQGIRDKRAIKGQFHVEACRKKID